MVLKLFRAKESGAKAVEASDFYAKISKRIEDGLNPFSNTELIDGVNVNL